MEPILEFNTTLKRKPSSLSWNYQIDIPITIANQLITKDSRRVICTINELEAFHAALMPNGEGDFFIMVNKKTRKKLKLEESAEMLIQLKKDDSKYGVPMPEEMKELLLVDEEGDAFFHQLTAGKQRSLLIIIGKIKSTDIRIKKSVIILDHLKTNKGNLDFKMLNEAFKESNQR